MNPQLRRRSHSPLTARLRPRLVVLASSILLSMALLEAGARTFAAITHQSRGMVFDEQLGWRPLPSVSKIGTVWGVSRPATTNTHGWRDRERSYRKPPGVSRIVAIGDSFTFGSDVDDGERFTDVLEGLLDGVEVINLGVPGYGTDQELRLLETQALRYEPDVVLLIACVFNDLDDITYSRLYAWPKPHYTAEDTQLVLHQPIRTWDIRIRSWSYVAEYLWPRLLAGAFGPSVPVNLAMEEKAHLFDLLALRLAEVVSARGARLLAVLAYGPDRLDDDAEQVARYMTAAFSRASMPVLDTATLFHGHERGQSSLYASTGIHWSPKGHQVVAEGLREFLSRHGVD